MLQNRLETRIAIRPARAQDFDFCMALYFAGMDEILRHWNLDRRAQIDDLRRRWVVPEVRIVTFDGADIGWLQSREERGAFFLAQIFVEAAFQRRGIGTEVMKLLIGEASHAGQALTLGVVRTNPALRFYERLGFAITHQDERKFYMRRELGAAGTARSP